MNKLGALGLALMMTLGLVGSSALAGQPAQKFVVDVTDVAQEIDCGATTYSLESGELVLVVREGQSASGNVIVSETFVVRDVIAMDGDGAAYAVRGAGHDVHVFLARADGEPGLPNTATFAETLQIIPLSGGGTVGSVSLAHHLTNRDGHFVLHEFDFGACTENSNPEE